MKEKRANFAIIFLSLAYIILKLLSIFKGFSAKSADIIFLTLLVSISFHRLFIEKYEKIKLEAIGDFLMLLGGTILIIAYFRDLMI